VTFEDGDNRAMATDRTDVMLSVFAATNRRDFDAALAETAPDVVVDFSVSNSPYRGVNHITGRGAGRGIEVDARGGHVSEVVTKAAAHEALPERGRGAPCACPEKHGPKEVSGD
jgi:hypothetical protein